MEYAFIGLALIVIAGFAALFAFIKLKFDAPSKDRAAEQGFMLLQNQMNELARTLDGHMRSQFSASAGIIKDVTERLMKLDETNRQVVGFTEQLRSLQDILKNPKQRGILGEYYLETVLNNVFGASAAYAMQHPFKNGDIVDAIVRGPEGYIIPIDSKFSLENYNRLVEAKTDDDRARHERAFRQDLKNRIDETSKYIRPEEGTTDFAIMFIPSEAIYYDLLINRIGAVDAQDLVEYAVKEQRVMIASPTSFFAYLQTILQGLKTVKMQKETHEIIKRVQDLGRHIKVYEGYFGKVGNHLDTTVNAYNAAYKELAKIDKDVLKIGGEAAGITPLLVDKTRGGGDDGA
jgi:DNA recombination protein RmuC